MAEELAPGSASDLPSGELLLETLKESIQEVFAMMMIPIDDAPEGASKGSDPQASEQGEYEVSVDFEGSGCGSVVLRCTDRGARDIARGLLMLEAEDTLEESDIYDALAECANLVTGTLKTKVLDPVAEFAMGVPRTEGPLPEGREKHEGALAYRLSTGSISAEVWLG